MKKKINIQKRNTQQNKRQKTFKQNTTKQTSKPTKKLANKNPLQLRLIILTIILVITTIAYFPSLDNEFTNWDDNGYVKENAVIQDFSVSKMAEMFTRYDMGNYHPLTMITLAIDHKFSDKLPPEETGGHPIVSPALFHLNNLILHLLNTVLVFFLVFKLLNIISNKSLLEEKKYGDKFNLHTAAIVAMLFGVNTLHVESVAWVAERKDVLYTIFFLASLVSYLNYIKETKIKYLFFSLVFFLLSLFSKGQAVTLTVSLVAIDYVTNRKLISKSVILEKIPFLLLSIIFGVVAIFAQKAGDAIHDIAEYPFYQRILFACYGFTMYFVKMVAPFKLAAIYPYPHLIDGKLSSIYWFFPIPAFSIAAVFIYSIKKNFKLVAFSLGFFIVNIFVLLQLLPVGSAIMADRYSYIPSIGFFLLIGIGAKWIFDNRHSLSPIVYVAIIGLTLFWSITTFNQTKIWKNSVTLWTSTLNNQPTALVGWNNFGSAMEKKAGKLKKANKIAESIKVREIAVEYFSRAIILKPDYIHAFYNRGTAKKDIGIDKKDTIIIKDAINDFNTAIGLDNNFVEAYHNRGISKENYGEIMSSITGNPTFNEIFLNAAISDYSKALSIKPDMHKLYSSRGVAKGKLGSILVEIEIFKQKEKMKQYKLKDEIIQKINEFKLSDKQELLNKAIVDFNKGIEVEPTNPEAYSNRGFAKVQLGKIKEGIEDYNVSLKMRPFSEEALLNRAIAYWVLRDTASSLADYGRLLEVKPLHVAALKNRAVLRYNIKDWTGAIADYSNLLTVYQDVSTYDFRSRSRYNIGDYKGVIEDCNVIIKQNKQYGPAYYFRGMSKIKIGDKIGGCQDLTISGKFGIVDAREARIQYCR